MRVLDDGKIWGTLSGGKALVLIAGPCVIESQELCLEVAGSLKETCKRNSWLSITHGPAIKTRALPPLKEPQIFPSSSTRIL